MGFHFKLEDISNQRIQTNEVTVDPLPSSLVLLKGEISLVCQDPALLLICLV